MKDLLYKRTKTTPEKEAIIASDNSSYTYQGWNKIVTSYASKIREIGISRGDRIGVLMESHFDFSSLLYAAIRTGSVAIGLSPKWNEERIQYQLDQLQCKACITSDDQQEKITQLSSDIPIFTLRNHVPSNIRCLDNISTSSFSFSSVDQKSPPLVLFTSGTTGPALPVELGYRQIRSSIHSSAYRLGIHPDDLWLTPLPPYHIGGLAPILRSTVYGTRVICTNTDLQQISGTLSDHPVTGISLVPRLLEQLLQNYNPSLLSDLRFVLLGGGPISNELIDRALSHNIPVYPTYGMTETCSQITTATPEQASKYGNTCGRPMFGMDIDISENNESSKQQEKNGEIVVNGPQVMYGYLDQPENTDRKLKNDRFRTGDYGFLNNDGLLFVTGRKSEKIVSGGKNINPAEVESALENHQQVQEAAVVGIEDAEWGEKVCALIAPSGDLDTSTLEKYLGDRLASYKIPKEWSVTEKIPQTPNRKIDRDRVKEMIET